MQGDEQLLKQHLSNLEHCPDFMNHFHLEWEKMVEEFRSSGKSEDFIDGVLTGIVTMTHAIDKAFAGDDVRYQ